jgi:hypothetical protein
MNVIGVEGVSDELRNSPLIVPLPEHTVKSAIRKYREQSEALAREKGVPSPLCMINHPHWVYYDIQAEDLMANPEIKYFEVCNNTSAWDVPEGMDDQWYNDKLWDVVNAYRYVHGQTPLYGIATEDTHFYPDTGIKYKAFKDGYIMVRAASLSQESLFAAIDRGDFYAASQLDLEDVNFDSANKTLSVSVPSIAGVACKIRFIVTKKGVSVQPLSYVDIPANERRKWHSRRVAIYDDRIGETAKLVAGGKGERLEASYKLKDDDLYVRARIESDWPGQFAGRRSLHPHNRTAWTQPYGHEYKA